MQRPVSLPQIYVSECSHQSQPATTELCLNTTLTLLKIDMKAFLLSPIGFMISVRMVHKVPAKSLALLQRRMS